MTLRPPIIEDIRREVAEFTERKRKAGQMHRVFPTGPDAGILRTKPAAEWMKLAAAKPAARQLFGSFWFEGELCILFADTNLGKSVLAVQIADAITRNYDIEPFDNQADEITPLLYVDFELGAKQFETRYTCPRWGMHHFAEHFYRAQFNPEADDPVRYASYEQYIHDAVALAVQQTKARVLIIDNITYMRHGTERAVQALPLMKSLKALKTKHNLSVLVLAHTPKRNHYSPITANDLQGSKMLINFADSAFAMGRSHRDPDLRYLKQIKQRNVKEQYGAANVCLLRMEKYYGMLRYKFGGHAAERDHLMRLSGTLTAAEHDKVIQLHNEGLSLRKIADQVGIHFTTAGRIVRENKRS